MLTKPLGQLVGAFVEALQLLQLLPGHLQGEEESGEGCVGSTVPTAGALALSGFSPPPLALSHHTGGFCPGPALTFLSSRYSMSAVL